MQFHHDAPVMAADGKEVGHLDRIVLDPKIKDITHIIVHKGFFLGQDKVIPVDWVASADEHAITLKRDAKEVEVLPEFRESEYLPLDEEELGIVAERFAFASPVYWYPPAGLPIPAPYVKLTKENIPEGTVPLKEGARVVSRDGKVVGEIEEVITDEANRHATHIVIAKGLVMKERVYVPTTWIDRVEEDQVRLAVGSRIVEQINSPEQRPVPHIP